MKIHGLAVWGCLLLASEAGAQVPNDDCANAQDLELVLNIPTCYVFGSPAQLLFDSTDLAMPNFPYPSNPGTCFGFWVVPNVPSNDRWYRFLISSGHSVDYSCTALDSLQLSWWQGNDCAFMTQLDCSSLLPGETINRSRPGIYHPGIDTLYLQVSSASVNSQARYELCYREEWGTGPVTYGSGLPTPVLCLEQEVAVVAASDIFTADGSIEVNVVSGNGPFSIFWADGSVDFVRLGLQSGTYPYTVSDIENCQLQDTAIVQVTGPTGFSVTSTDDDPVLYWAADGLYCTTPATWAGGTIGLYDTMGRVLLVAALRSGRQRLVPMSSTPTPFMFVIAVDHAGANHTVGRTPVPLTP